MIMTFNVLRSAMTALLVVAHPSTADEVQNALNELNLGTQAIGKDLVRNGGVRYFLLNPGKLDSGEFVNWMNSRNEIGRARLLFLASRSEPGKFPFHVASEFARKSTSNELKYIGYAVATRLLQFNNFYRRDEQTKRLQRRTGCVPFSGHRAADRVKLDGQARKRLDALLSAHDALLTAEDRRARAKHVLGWLHDLPDSPYLEDLVCRERGVAVEVVTGALAAFARKELSIEKTARIMLGSGRKIEALSFARAWIDEGCKRSVETTVLFCTLFYKYGESTDAVLLRSLAAGTVDTVKKLNLTFYADRLSGRK
jgi:hypothetical protein